MKKVQICVVVLATLVLANLARAQASYQYLAQERKCESTAGTDYDLWESVSTGYFTGGTEAQDWYPYSGYTWGGLDHSVLTSDGISLVGGDVYADNLSASEINLTAEFTVTEDCYLYLGWDMQQDMAYNATTNMEFYVLDETTDELLFMVESGDGTDSIFLDGGEDGHTYRVVIHGDALSVGSGVAECEIFAYALLNSPP